MSEEILHAMLDKFGKKIVRISVATLAVIATMLVAATLFISSWQRKIDHAWLVYDMQEYSWQMKLSNSNLVVPDAQAIVAHRIENEKR